MSRPPFLRPGVGAHLAASARFMGLALRHGVIALRIGVMRVLASVAAVLVLFWEWGWRPLAAALGRLSRLQPIARLETAIRGLPPYGALVVFALPSALLLPLKLFALYLVAQGYKLAAAALFVGAKVVGTALVARLYMLTQATLLQIGWFRRAYHVLMPIKEALTVWVRGSAVWQAASRAKARIKQSVKPLVASVRAQLVRVRAFWHGRGNRGQRG